MAAANTTLAKITAEIASHLHKEMDEPFKRLLAEKVDAWRGTLLRRTLQEHPGDRKFFRQTIYVALTKTVKVPECIDPNAPVCHVMRTNYQLPDPIRANGILYDYVGAVDGKNAFRHKEPGMGDIMLAGKYSKGLILWEEIGDYIDVDNSPGLPLIRVDGVFGRPSDVALFNCETVSLGCDYWNEPYPVSADIKQAIVECILKVDFHQGVTPANKEIEVTPQLQEHAPDGR